MPKLHKVTIGLVTASVIALGTFAGSAFAQANADQIRNQCINEVMEKYPGSSDDLQTVRTNLYIACMQRNGLKP